jgi:hypothetical protein
VLRRCVRRKTSMQEREGTLCLLKTLLLLYKRERKSLRSFVRVFRKSTMSWWCLAR